MIGTGKTQMRVIVGDTPFITAQSIFQARCVATDTRRFCKIRFDKCLPERVADLHGIFKSLIKMALSRSIVGMEIGFVDPVTVVDREAQGIIVKLIGDFIRLLSAHRSACDKVHSFSMFYAFFFSAKHCIM